MAVTVGQLSEKLEDLYWKSAHREVCNMILFFLELQSNMEMYEAQSVFPGCPNFENMFNVWSKYLKPLHSSLLEKSRLTAVAGSQGARANEFNTQRLFEDTLERAKRKRGMASMTLCSQWCRTL